MRQTKSLSAVLPAILSLVCSGCLKVAPYERPSVTAPASAKPRWPRPRRLDSDGNELLRWRLRTHAIAGDYAGFAVHLRGADIECYALERILGKTSGSLLRPRPRFQ
jgi:hypothetical protein